jgi:hypothetical protein
MAELNLDSYLRPSHYFTRNIRSLDLLDSYTPDIVLALLLYLLNALNRSGFSGSPAPRAAPHYTVNVVQRFLNIQSQSFKYITLNIIPGREALMPLFSNFPYLENLQMSAHYVLCGKPSNAI